MKILIIADEIALMKSMAVALCQEANVCELFYTAFEVGVTTKKRLGRP